MSTVLLRFTPEEIVVLLDALNKGASRHDSYARFYPNRAASRHADTARLMRRITKYVEAEYDSAV